MVCAGTETLSTETNLEADGYGLVIAEDGGERKKLKLPDRGCGNPARASGHVNA
jgi:hypothetical protein